METEVEEWTTPAGSFRLTTTYFEDYSEPSRLLEKRDGTWREKLWYDFLIVDPGDAPNQTTLAHLREAMAPAAPGELARVVNASGVKVRAFQEDVFELDGNRVVKFQPVARANDEWTIATMLSENDAISAVKVLATASGRSNAFREPTKVMVMKKYTQTALDVVRAAPADQRGDLALRFCSLALEEVARIKCAYDYFRHGDLHLDNLFVEKNASGEWTVVLGDFGFARLKYTSFLPGKRAGVRVYKETTTTLEARRRPDDATDMQIMQNLLIFQAPGILNDIKPLQYLSDTTAAQTRKLAALLAKEIGKK